eukprot:INCI4160.1.p1 GENE.INCI4160.1~~INCI4160.1.p1  ORF type:complete len:326 (-),score=40.99 INCI4160.1:322-1299(-)
MNFFFSTNSSEKYETMTSSLESLFSKNSCWVSNNTDSEDTEFDELALFSSEPNCAFAPNPQRVQSFKCSKLAQQWRALVVKFYEDVKAGHLITTKKPDPLPDNFEEFFQCALQEKMGDSNPQTIADCENLLGASAASFIMIFGFNNTRKRLVPSTTSKSPGQPLRPHRVAGLNCVAAAFGINRRTMRRHLFRALGFPASGSSSAERVHFNKSDFSIAKTRLLFFGTAAAETGSAVTAAVSLQQPQQLPKRSNFSTRPGNEQSTIKARATQNAPTGMGPFTHAFPIRLPSGWLGQDGEYLIQPSRQSSCLNNVPHWLGVGVGGLGR